MSRSLLVVIAVALGGCATADRTTVEMYVRTGDDRQMRYFVDHHGMLHFGGGWNAIDRRFTFTQELTEAQEAELAALIAAGGWLTDPPRSPRDVAGTRYDVKYRSPEGSANFEYVGDSPAVADVRDFLESIALGRVTPALDTLPKPSRETMDDR